MAGVAGRVAFLTGAGSGIGRITAQVLAKGGADIVVTDINEAGAEETAQTVTELGRKAFALKVDVSDLQAVEAAAATASQELGRIDILFSNAGIGTQAAFAEMTEAQWDEMFNIHLNGTYHCFPGCPTRNERAGLGAAD